MIPGMSPKQMKNMQRQMKKMGMDMNAIDGVQEVIIRCEDMDLIISPADVSLMTVMGQETYQVTGTAVEVEKEIEIPDEDIEMVANTAGVSLEAAEEALRETGGDLAEAILKLNE